MFRGALVVFALVGIAVVALLSAVQSDFEPGGSAESERRELRGPALPAPGFLQGTIRVSTADGCASIDLSTVEEVRASSAARCTPAQSLQPTASASLVLSGGVELDESDFLQGLTRTNAEPLVVLGYDEQPDGAVAVAIERRAGVLLRERYGKETRPLPIGTRESFAAAIASSHGGALPELVVQLWRGEKLLDALPLSTIGYYPVAGHSLGEIVRFGPGGTELIVASGGDEGRLILVDLRSRGVVLGPIRQDGFSWSPDGRWLAIAGEGGIGIFGITRSDPVFLLPVRTTFLAWD